MKKKILLPIILVSCFTSMSFTTANSKSVFSGVADSYKILDTYSNLTPYLMGKNFDLDDFRIESVEVKYVSIENMNQTRLNELYNSDVRRNIRYYGVNSVEKVTGTCSEVAVTMASKKYLGSEFDTNYSNFKENLNYAYDNEYFPKKQKLLYDSQYNTYHHHVESSGTGSGDCQYILNNSLNTHGVYSNIRLTTNNIYDKVKESTNSGTVNIIGIKDHDLISSGYVEFKCSYTKNSWFFGKKETKYKTERFIVVCDGWEDATASGSSATYYKDKCYSYIDADLSINYLVELY